MHAPLKQAREEIPGLIEDLRDGNPDGAEWIEDVFSEVLRQLRLGRVKDPEMVSWLYESIRYHTTHRRRFGVHESRRRTSPTPNPL